MPAAPKQAKAGVEHGRFVKKADNELAGPEAISIEPTRNLPTAIRNRLSMLSFNRHRRKASFRRPQRVGHAAEVVAEDGEFDGVREVTRMPDERAPKQPPISHAPPMPHAQHPERFQEGNAIRPQQVQ